jgi:hypothetical protein
MQYTVKEEISAYRFYVVEADSPDEAAEKVNNYQHDTKDCRLEETEEADSGHVWRIFDEDGQIVWEDGELLE